MSDEQLPEESGLTPEEQVLAETAEILDGVEVEGDAAVEPSPDTALAELTADLQRLQAEYVNYRKRVERDRAVARDNAVGEVILALLPLLDDFARAEEHGELTGAFKSVADNFDAVLSRFGVEKFAEAGEEFDPMLHEALAHEPGEVLGEHRTVIANVYQRGFRLAGRVLRPARVVVKDVAQ